MSDPHPTPPLLQRALGSTLAVARAFPATSLDTYPAPGMMSIREMIDHLAYNLEFVIEPIAQWLGIPAGPAAGDVALARLERANARVHDVMRQVPENKWLHEVEYPDGFTMSVLRAALVMLEHDAHHRGQLIVALRNLGVSPPPRWPES